MYSPRIRREKNNCSISEEEKLNDNKPRPYLEAIPGSFTKIFCTYYLKMSEHIELLTILEFTGCGTQGV